MLRSLRSPADAVKIIYCDDILAVAETNALCVVIWRGAVTSDPFDRQSKGLDEVVHRNPRRAGFICVVESTAKAPDDELRRASGQMIASHGEHLRCVACVIEGQGFKAAINRGAVAAMTLFVRNRKTPVSVFATVADAAMWMGGHMDVGSPDQLVANVEHIRSAFPLR